jgi:hypothetical protein
MYTFKMIINYAIQCQIAYVRADSEAHAIARCMSRYPHAVTAQYMGITQKQADF